MRWSIGMVVAVALGVGCVSPARAQVSPVSELWRVWAVLEQQWREEKAEVERDRARLLERRKARAGEAAEAPTPKRGG